MATRNGAALNGRALPVLGRGAVSCFGTGTMALLDAVFAGRCGIAPLRRFAGLDVLTAVAAELPQAVITEATGMPLVAWLARAAAEQAIAEAGLAAADVALVLATTRADLGGIDGLGDGFGSPLRLLDTLVAALGIGGPSLAVSSACASGLSALAMARRWLLAGQATAVLVVGADVLSTFVLRGFSALLALDPGPCRPFDRSRRGLSLGEGAGALVLGASGPSPLGVALLGAGESNDAHGITTPSPDGRGLLRACRAALATAGLTPLTIDVVHLHGTGTPYNDTMEGAAMTALFEPVPPLTACKAQIGHTLGAAGLLESLVAIEMLRTGSAPANHGLIEPDGPANLRLLRERTELPRHRTCLKVAAGFGGIDAALVFGA